MKRLAVLVPLLWLLTLSKDGQAQDDAKHALAVAVQSAAIEGEGATPFRLTAKYETFDFMGRPASSGTLEELFLRPGMRKRTLTEGGSVDKFSPDDNVAAVADQAPADGYVERLMAAALFEPGPTAKSLEEGTVRSKERKFGDVVLTCVTLDSKQPDGKTVSSSRLYCLDGKKPLLRTAEQQYGLLAVYNKVVVFGAHTLSEDMALQQRGKMRARVQVVSIAAAPELKESDFPKDAAPSERPTIDFAKNGKARLSSGVASGNILTKVAPVYPPSSRAARISGSVILHAIIGKDGGIKDLDVISAPADDLAEAAIDAVSQWRYKPYLLNGQPTEVDTTLTVNFSIGR